MISIKSIAEKLNSSFLIQKLEVLDESHKHVGHQGWKHGVVTHVKIIISAKDFQCKKLIDSHRMIQNVLVHELASGLHAISIKVE